MTRRRTAAGSRPGRVLAAAVWAGLSACANDALPRQIAPGIEMVGRLADPLLEESSGIVASRRHPGVFWTHNDGGRSAPLLFAVDRSGAARGCYAVRGATLVDWEDLASDEQGHLYLGDIGNEGTRRQIAVHEVDEPVPDQAVGSVFVRRSWILRYPDQPFDCESLLVRDGRAYLISRGPADKKGDVYRFDLGEAREVVLERVGKLGFDASITGADLTPDGRRLGLVATTGAFVLSCDLADPDSIKASPPYHAKLEHAQLEGCCFTGDGLLATAESREVLLFTAAEFRDGR